jgi:hypothetical protein
MIKKSLNLAYDCEVRGNSGEDKLIYERNAFYNERLKDLRIFLICSNISNMVFQIDGLLSPANNSHFILSIIYTLNSIICLILQLITFKNEKYMSLISLNTFLFVLRMAVRLLDYEETFEHIGPSRW